MAEEKRHNDYDITSYFRQCFGEIEIAVKAYKLHSPHTEQNMVGRMECHAIEIRGVMVVLNTSVEVRRALKTVEKTKIMYELSEAINKKIYSCEFVDIVNLAEIKPGMRR
ncbi:MAG: hypothetical protein IJ837_00970 [Clostridia bacterium]|nr:hypothetical protein [Clostridia bacterium]